MIRTSETTLLTHARQDRREGLLGADHVAVEPADQRPGLGAGEEGDRLAQHVGEHLGAQRVDEPLADPAGVPALDQRQQAADDGQAGHDEGELDDHTAVARA